MAQSDLTKDSFSFVTPDELAIKKKIEKVGTSLKEWDINIYRGLQTGNNKVFIINQNIKEKLIKENISSKDIIFPIVLGKEINKYDLTYMNNYIIYINDETNLSDYPAINNYMLENKHLLDSKLEVKQGKMEWFALYRPAKSHLKEFDDEKLIWNFVTEKLQFSYTNNKIFLLNSSFMMKGNNLKYLLSILNSKIADFYIKFVSSPPNIGAKAYMEQIPIPNIPKEEQEPFINLVDTIMDSKEKIAKYNKHFESLNAIDKIEIKEEIEKLEALILSCVDEVDRLVYGLYGLSDGEVGIVGK